jgi:hypothetical protein
MDHYLKDKPLGDPTGIPQTWDVKNKDVLVELESPFLPTMVMGDILRLLGRLEKGEIRSITIIRKQA